MDLWVFLILGIFGYIIYRGLSSDTESELPRRNNGQYQRKKTGRVGNYQNREKESFITSAKRQENMGNYDEASRLYLRAGQIFSAAKMKAMKGPQFAVEAVQIVQVNSPSRAELITRNLANDFFYRLEQPAISAALLRGLGLNGEAEAVEVAAGISVNQSYQEPAVAASSPEVHMITEEPEVKIKNETEIDNTVSSQSNIVEQEETIQSESSPIDKYPNSMMLASATQDHNCSVCRREIKSGDSFIYCLNCGKPGHYAHLGEMIKVTGKCPVCKKRLTPTMYDI